MQKLPLVISQLLSIILFSCSELNYNELLIDDSVIENIKGTTLTLEENGPRNAGTDKEEATARLIIDKLEKAGIKTDIEVVEYKTFNLTSAELIINNKIYIPTFIGINSFDENYSIEGRALTIDQVMENSIPADKIIVLSDNPDHFFLALQQNAKTFISIGTADLNAIRGQGKLKNAKINITGKGLDMKTANLIAGIGNNPENSETIYITAHYDSYLDSPGANDNGTGLSGAIELACLLKKAENNLPYNIKFIFTGGEEIGLVGSRAYVENHLSELKNCKCLINLDTFGGKLAPFIAAAPGLNGTPENGYTDPTPDILRMRSLEGPDGSWRFFDMSLFSIIISSNYPEWYQEIVKSSADKLNMKVTTRQLMSDHLTFAAAGVPSISIQSREHTIHSKEDTTDNINYESVRKCMSLTLGIIKELMNTKSV